MDADKLLMIFGGSFGGVIALAVVVGLGIEAYRRYFMPDENELTEPQSNV